jgi:hypothetical protein
MTKPNYAEIVMLLDRSGSMSTVLKDTIGGFNSFVREQRNNKVGEVRLSLYQFDDKYDVVYEGRPIQDVPDLTTETFIPRGMTALFDATGKTINALGERLSKMYEQDRPSLVIFVILTDGEENSSKEFRLERVKEIIKHQTERYNWKFVFLGADQDAFQATQMGISANNTYNYASGHSDRMYRNLSKGISYTVNAMSTGQACAAADNLGVMMRDLDLNDSSDDHSPTVTMTPAIQGLLDALNRRDLTNNFANSIKSGQPS